MQLRLLNSNKLTAEPVIINVVLSVLFVLTKLMQRHHPAFDVPYSLRVNDKETKSKVESEDEG